MKSSPALTLGIATVAALVAASPRALAGEALVEYSRDVRPILSKHCFACHGPDADTRKAGLALDTRDGATAALKSGNHALVPGDTAGSELVARITDGSPRHRMPPEKFGKPLAPEQIATLTRWVAQGGDYRPHWSFVPPTRPPAPALAPDDPLAAWPRNDVDRFLLARMREEGLAPSPEAPRETLLRRVTLDLTGLPPTPSDADAFLADRRPDAWERVVDRLLASPRCAEHEARLWLDLARYGDTHGYHLDNERALWPWREWVIDAFQQDEPFDQFTIEQLAGDLLPDATPRQRLATGFLRCNPTSGEGGLIEEEYLVKYVVDRVNDVGTVWLGLTVGCAQCHDHKFDPITQRDYYGLFAFFHSIAERGSDENALAPAPAMRAPTSAQAATLAAAQARLAAIEAQAAARFATLDPASATSAGGATLRELDDHSLLAEGTNPDRDVDEVAFADAPATIAALRVEALADPSLPQGGPGRFANANFVLTGVEAELVAASGGVRKLEFASAEADHEQESFPARLAIDGDAASGWAILPELRSHAAWFTLKAPVARAADETLRVRLRFESRFAQHAIGRMRFAAASEAAPSGLAAAKAAVAEADAAIPSSLIAAELPQPRVTRVLKRGQYDQPGDVVTPALPAALGRLPDGAPANRLALARWLVARDQPLTARVAVNRFWAQLFGVGLVKTAQDFGAQGEWPANRALLDWLAVEFMEEGWSVRRLLRLLVTSAAYRQSSVATPKLLARDRDDRLLARAPRFRLDAEVIRDCALAEGGLLVERIGGRSVKPYQPGDLWKTVAYPTSNTASFVQDHGEALWRRSLYTFWKRTSPPPDLAAFDAPSREACTVQRARTDTPLQALVALNDVQFVEAARALAQRVLREAGRDPALRATLAWRLVVGRRPDERELAVTLRSAEREEARFDADRAAAAALLSQGEAPLDASLPQAELAAWTIVASTLQNLDEAITKE